MVHHTPHHQWLAVFTVTLHCATPHLTSSHYTTPHYTTLHHATPHRTALHHTTLRHTMPHHTTPHFTTLHYATPHHTTPHTPHTPHYTTPHYTFPLKKLLTLPSRVCLSAVVGAEKAFRTEDGPFDVVFNLAAETKYGQAEQVQSTWSLSGSHKQFVLSKAVIHHC